MGAILFCLIMLYVVATPIGNLGDITLRAVETLRGADLIIAENPSYTRRLLNHFEIKGKKLVQFAEHNEFKVVDGLTSELKDQVGCLVTDAGTPGVSDPGFRLVRSCIDNNIQVVPIPGVSAVITALSASGSPTDRFLFVGFLPKTEPKVLKIIQEVQVLDVTLVFYESPQRLVKTLGMMVKHVPQARLVIARELTKLHEEFARGSVEELYGEFSKRATIKGEIVGLLSFK
jgi:16S rRNA (cytidine1402-2'-O)-methyltransferase